MTSPTVNPAPVHAKHTPGPWVVFEATLKGRVRARQLLIQPAGHEHPNDFSDIVAELPWQHLTVDEREANARLIAMAPDLLAVAEMAVELWDSTSAALDPEEVLSAIRAVIVAAKGGA